MGKESSKSIIPVILIGYIVFIALLVITGTFEEQAGEIVELTGLPRHIHNLVLFVVWPLVMSVIMAVVFPRVFVPLFLKVKQLIWRQYENAFIELEPGVMTWRKFLIRMIFCFLLVMGMELSLAPLIDPSSFLSAEDLQYFASMGLQPEYAMNYFGGVAALIAPLAVGIWSIGWMLEDSGLIHFNIPETKDTYYEIEPIHFKFNNYLRGFAGLSALLYYAGVLYAYLTTSGYWETDILWSMILWVIFIFIVGPSYIVYWKLGRKSLHQGLREAKRISKTEILKT